MNYKFYKHVDHNGQDHIQNVQNHLLFESEFHVERSLLERNLFEEISSKEIFSKKISSKEISSKEISSLSKVYFNLIILPSFLSLNRTTAIRAQWKLVFCFMHVFLW